ncbi:MAG: hypothetical protein RL088_3439 [Verrucomicrobiota bacterium]|jgi:hypothetical protein
MKHIPKFTDLCQCLVNACQAAGPIKGASVTLTEEAATHLAIHLPTREFEMFDIQHAGPKTFSVRLRDNQPQPQPPTT